MDFKQISMNLNLWFAQLGKKLEFIYNFVLYRLKNYKHITPIEQIVYPLVGVGIILILVSLFMFLF
jgi:hypothetical protein